MRSSRFIRGTIAAVSAAAWMQACTIAPPKPVAEPPPAPPPPPTPVVQTESHAPQPSVAPVAALIEQALNERRAGRLEQAAANVERALRIDPYDAGAWQLLAAIRLQQGDAAQAEVMAMRSNGIAAENQALRRDNWLLIAQARRLQGDLQGAEIAEQRAAQHEGAF